MSRDPIGDPDFELLRGMRSSLLIGGPNRHAFVLNNSLSIVDPFGLSDWKWPSWPNKKKEKGCCDMRDAKPIKELAISF